MAANVVDGDELPGFIADVLPPEFLRGQGDPFVAGVQEMARLRIVRVRTIAMEFVAKERASLRWQRPGMAWP